MKRDELLLTVASLLFTLALYWAVRDPNTHRDEWVHFDQIHRIIAGVPNRNPALTTFPTYHYLLAFPARFYPPAGGLPFLRMFAFFLSALSIVAFYRMASFVDSPSSLLRTLQYCFLPITFPLFFLLYTDLFSMAFIFAALYFVIRKRYTLAGIAALGAMITRQNNLIWILLCCVLIYDSEKHFLTSLKKGWVFVLLLVAFAIFAIVNHGVAIGDRDKHPWMLTSGNVFFMLLLFFIFFLPLHLKHSRDILDLIKRNKKTLLLIPLLYLLYFFTFSPTHPYNQAAYSFFLRNRLLLFMNSSLLWKTLFFMPMIYSVFTLMVTKFIEPRYYWFYPASVLFVLPSWLIEQRYYLIPFSLFLIARKQDESLTENTLLIVYAPTAMFFLHGILADKFFL